MYLLQLWFNLSDEGTEDAIYDSYAMRKFVGINFLEEDAPDATTLLKFRRLLEQNGLNKLFFKLFPFAHYKFCLDLIDKFLVIYQPMREEVSGKGDRDERPASGMG